MIILDFTLLKHTLTFTIFSVLFILNCFAVRTFFSLTFAFKFLSHNLIGKLLYSFYFK